MSLKRKLPSDDTLSDKTLHILRQIGVDERLPYATISEILREKIAAHKEVNSALLKEWSLLPLLKGEEDGQDRTALSENYRDGFAGRMIRTPRWKYFFYTDGEEYLYDMQADPGEEHNLSKEPQYRKLADELKQKASVGWVEGREEKAKNPPDKAKKKKKK